MKNLKTHSKMNWLVFICLMASVPSMAQMEPARRITYDIDTTVKFNVSVSVLWDAIKQPAKWADISNGYIKSISVIGDLPQQSRVVTFADGTQRKDIVTQYQPEYRFIVFKITDPISPAIKDNILGFTVATEGKGVSSLHIMTKVEGVEKEKRILLNSLKKEMDEYISGLTELFSENNKTAD